MKKKGIILSIIGIILISSLIITLIENSKKTFIYHDGVLLAMTLDGYATRTFPSNRIKYHVDITCDNGAIGKYEPVRIIKNGIETDEYEYKFLVEGAKAGVTTCNLAFTTVTDDSEYLLNNVVKNNASSSEEILASYTGSESVDVGYRYTGKNPNNYVWFNDELWRIIGSIPTCLTENCGTNKTNLVKIIRSESIGGYSYDVSSTTETSRKGRWGQNTLYKLLNNYYYGKLNANTDTTGKTYCYSYYTDYKPVPNCDYTVRGISNDENNYYNKMIADVYWNSGMGLLTNNPVTIYAGESSAQALTGKIGLMYLSDYGLAGLHVNKAMDTLGKNTDYSQNWLYSHINDQTMTWHKGAEYISLYVSTQGNVAKNTANINGFAVRPVVFLKENTHVIGGSGTQLDPYILGI